MKLYYHKTDWGAEYYCTQAVEGTDEGDLRYAVMRTDCNELELFMANLADKHIRVVIER